MTRNKLVILLMSIPFIAAIAGCGGSEKNLIEDTMRAYVERSLSTRETFDFIGLSNRRDTIFMGTSHPCAGVIYTIGNENGHISRRYADVIFSNDYTEVLSFNELDFNPIEYTKDKVKDALNDKIRKKFCK